MKMVLDVITYSIMERFWENANIAEVKNIVMFAGNIV